MLESLFPGPQDVLPPTPSWYQHAAVGICILSIFLPPGPIRLSTGLLLLILIIHATFWTYAPTYNEYTVSTTSMTTLFAWIDFVACHDLEHDFWKVEKDAEGHVVEKRVPNGVWEKLKWSTLFWFGYRKIGWNIQVSSISPAVPSDYPRSRFLRQMFLKTIKMYLSLDLASTSLRLLSHSRNNADFFKEPLFTQVLSGWATASRAYFGMSFIYHIAAFIAVLLSLTPLSSWPPINGSFRQNFFSVRQTWGRLWHQFIRRYCTSAGRAVTRICHFKKGGFASRYTQLWIGFVVSALMHAPPAVMWSDRGFWQAMAFLSQPAAIMVEDLVIHCGKVVGLRDNGFIRSVGYLWTFLWFSYSLRFWVATVPAQYAEGDELPSLIKYVIKRFEVKSVYGVEY
ncbi:uncharacterized protein LY89DRAFT_732445 [Mollisia scopiformis]|uniref:Wax synthase domain-containing protein n=1 Tax=Mollisia scopiformis TaxID=149040 RepID=A0A194XFI2_MOLSC|nr:uncharacterized protein LY89DRAFT_732445 [Mollisia scopiformis]KUJ18906.1 hypothetical protein LY89DRAFT_732445 [Mollisia scopiformis]